MKNGTEAFALPATPARSVVPLSAVDAFTSAERPAKHVIEAIAARTGEGPALVPSPSPAVASGSETLTVQRVPARTLKKLRQRALDEDTTVRELVLALLTRARL